MTTHGLAAALPVAAVDIASTFGWDTVFALPIADVNAAILRAGTSPPGFEAADTEDGYAVTGKFGPWRIMTGGSGDLVRLAIPLVDAVVAKPDRTEETAGGTAQVEVRLNFLHDVEARPPSGTLHHLKVRTTPVSPGVPVASVVQIDYSGTPPSFLAGAALSGMLEQWLNGHLEDFDHVFATVNLDRTADQGAFQWMQPTDVAYAYSDMGTSGDGVLGVLCMTENRNSAGLPQQISADVIPSGARAGFLVSRNRLLGKLLRPAMPQVFPGSVVDDYVMSATGESITNAAQNIGFEVQSDGKTYRARIADLVLTVEGRELQLSVTTVTEVSPGIQAFCQTQNFLGIRLVTKSDGTQTLGFYDSRPALSNHWTQTDPGIQITEEILGAVALIAALVATVATGGAAVGAVALVIGLVAGGMTLTTTIIQEVSRNDAPAIDALVLNCTMPIVWRDSKDFLLTGAGLNDSLQLGGLARFS